MLTWIQLDGATIPGDGGELRLNSGSEFSVVLGSTELMNGPVAAAPKRRWLRCAVSVSRDGTTPAS